jgi:hypothetical protein
MRSDLEQLIVDGNFDIAVEQALGMSPQRVGSLLSDEDSIEDFPENFDQFIRRLYRETESPYAKADIAYQLSGLYLTSLSMLENGFFAGRDFGLASARILSAQLIQEIEWLDTYVDCPDKAVPPATQKRFMSYVGQVKLMKFEPTTEESTEHEQKVTEAFEAIGEDIASWRRLYYSDQLSDPA